MTGLGVGLGRDPAALDPEAIGAEAAERALALVGARQPESRRCPVVLDAFVAASFVGFIGGMLSADAVQRGRSLFAGREGEEVAEPALELVDDGHRPGRARQRALRRRGVAHPPHPADPGRPAARRSCSTRAPRAARARDHGKRRRGSYRSPPSVGHLEPGRRARATPTSPSCSRDAGDGLYVTDVAGPPLGRQPGVRHLLGGRLRPAHRGRRAGRARCASSPSPATWSRCSAASARVGAESRWVPLGGSVKTPPLLIDEMAVSGV